MSASINTGLNIFSYPNIDTSRNISISTRKNTGISDNIDARIGSSKSANISSTYTIGNKNVKELKIRKKKI